MPIPFLAIPGALVIGFTLGLLGSGGSILTVPVLIYMLGQEDKVAIASSLAIVGIISLFGSISYIKQKLIDWRMVFYFGVPGVVGTYFGAWGSVLVSGTAQLAIFAAVMLVAAIMMVKPGQDSVDVDSCDENGCDEDGNDESAEQHPNLTLIMIEGLGVGILTGFVGVGGGFLIVPALVLFAGISMHNAIATSLVIISMKSLAGFAKYMDVLIDVEIDFTVIALFSAIGFFGCVLGGYVAPRIPQEQLKRGFCFVLIVMGAFIFYRTIPTLLT